MFDLARIQAALREDGLDGWLLYDFRGLNVLARRVLDMPRRADAVAALVLFYPGSRRTAKAGATASSPARSIMSRRPQHLSALAGAGSRRAGAGAGGQARRHGIRAAERQSVCLARRCRHHRTGAIVRRRDRAVGRPDPAIRGVLGRRAMGDAPRSGPAHALGVRRRRSASSPRTCARRIRSAKPTCSR